MDIKKRIEGQIYKITQIRKIPGLNSIMVHIDRGIYYLEKGECEFDENFYSDTVYRANQGFEGILKESFSVLTGNSGDNKTPYQIEEYFLKNKVLNPRVNQLFTNYRTQWRNPATHDHNLFFTRDEAFLAIINVTSFIYILLNQILEKIYIDTEEIIFKKNLIQLEELISEETVEQTGLYFKLGLLLSIFSKNIQHLPKRISEIHLIAAITAYLKTLLPSVKILREPTSPDNSQMRADLLISDGEDEVILEVKNYPEPTDENYELMFRLLSHYKIRYGILYYFPQDLKTSVMKGQMNREINGEVKQVLVVANFDKKVAEILKDID